MFLIAFQANMQTEANIFYKYLFIIQMNCMYVIYFIHLLYVL